MLLRRPIHVNLPHHATRANHLCRHTPRRIASQLAHGHPNHDRPAEVFVLSPHACSTVGEGKDAAAIDVTVTAACAPSIGSGKSAAKRAENAKAAEFALRVSDKNDQLAVDGAAEWTPPFQFRPFGIDTHGALGGEALRIVQQLAEKRAARWSLSVDFFKHIALEAHS